MPADLDAQLTHVYVLVDDLLPRRRQRGRPVRISDGHAHLTALGPSANSLELAGGRKMLSRSPPRGGFRQARRRAKGSGGFESRPIRCTTTDNHYQLG
jgi:hypothetical protein